MIKLFGQSKFTHLDRPLEHSVYRLRKNTSSSPSDFQLISLDLSDAPIELYYSHRETPSGKSHQIQLPSELDYLTDSNLITLSKDGKKIGVNWRGNETTNSLLLTERCDNYCLMCSQPPKEREDDWLLEEAFETFSMLPKDAEVIGLTGGEPTLYGERFIDLIKHAATCTPSTALHILSNGRRFSDPDFAADYAEVSTPLMMVGIPLYGTGPRQHDYVVQAKGAFEQTVNGILNLGEFGQSVEIRVVIHKQTAPFLVDIAEFIARNFPFVDQVAFMGLEMIGLARTNLNEVWIDPSEYSHQLEQAVHLLASSNIEILVYNQQLCLTPKEIWNFTVKSISDWKNEYDPICEPCEVKDQCGGFFSSAQFGSSGGVKPIDTFGNPLNSNFKSDAGSKWTRRIIPVTTEIYEP